VLDVPLQRFLISSDIRKKDILTPK